PRLRALAERAATNGVDCRLISMDEAREAEPHVGGVEALRVENTGIIDYAVVSTKLAELAENGGATLVLGSRVHGIRDNRGRVVVEHELGEVMSDVLINAAGLHSDVIARLAGMTPSARIIPFRGEYFELAESLRSMVRGL